MLLPSNCKLPTIETQHRILTPQVDTTPSSSYKAEFPESKLLRKQSFGDPPQWRDDRNLKTNPRSPDFKLTITNDSPWIDLCNGPFRAREELKRTSLQPLERLTKENENKEEEEHGSLASHDSGELHVGKRKKEVQEQEEELLTNGRYHDQKRQDENRGLHTLVSLLKACAKQKNLSKGREIHAEIAQSGLLGNNVLVGNTIVSMYAKCGSLTEAQEVCDKLPIRDAASWNAVIAGYAQHGRSKEALNCFKRMQSEGLSPNAVTFLCILKACGRSRSLDTGQKIHVEVVKEGLVEKDVLLGTALVDMYSKCGSLPKAQEVFDKLPVRDVVSWNSLITGYTQHECNAEALSYFECMQHDGLSPNAVTFACVLKACGSVGLVDKGQKIHAEILRQDLLGKDVVVGTALVDMYAKCGSLAKAQEVFDMLSNRDVVLWSALIAGYVQHGQGDRALECFEQMQREGISPNAFTFACILKVCGSIGAAYKGQEIHAEIAKEGLSRKDVVVGKALIDMYAECGLLVKAQEAFDMLLVQDVLLWNALIAGYAHHGHGKEALNCFQQMQLKGFLPNAATFVCTLQACGSIGDIDKGEELHADVVREGLLERDIVVGNALVDMYVKCDLLGKAQEVMFNLPVRDIVSWSTLIAGYSQHGLGEQAVKCYTQMQLEGLSPDVFAFACILKACGSIGAADEGQKVHAEIASHGVLENDVIIGSALVDMYAKCGLLAKAQDVFDKLPVRDVVLWNVLITGYAQYGHGEQAWCCFQRMKLEGFHPDAVTLICTLKACGSMGDASKAHELYAEIVKEGFLDQDMAIGNALIDVYAKCGLLARAEGVFNKIPAHNVVSWNALITGYVQHGQDDQALKCFEWMRFEGITPDGVTFLCILKACGSMGAAYKGQEIYAEVARDGLHKKFIVIGNATIDLYAKCGLIQKAHEMFEKLPGQDLISWNALLNGHALLGEAENVFHLFEKMIGANMWPDLVTFTVLLVACSHTGLLDKGQVYFEAMSTRFGIIPTLEHHICMIDLFGRAGHLDKALVVIKTMPFCANLMVWHTVLGACRKWGNIKLGRWIFKQAVHLDDDDAAAYVCMSNIYANTDSQDDAKPVF